jgi:hypothetical protein
MIFILFQPIFHSKCCSFKLVLRSKILATLIHRGKNFGDVFFDVFRKSEQESGKIMTVRALFAEIPH